MAVDKALYAAPMGLASLPDDMEEIEIEIVDPEELSIEGPGFSFHMEKEDEDEENFDSNLAEEMDEQALAMLASDLLGDYEDDLA